MFIVSCCCSDDGPEDAVVYGPFETEAQAHAYGLREFLQMCVNEDLDPADAEDEYFYDVLPLRKPQVFPPSLEQVVQDYKASCEPVQPKPTIDAMIAALNSLPDAERKAVKELIENQLKR